MNHFQLVVWRNKLILRRFHGEGLQNYGDFFSGIVGALSPWNFPLPLLDEQLVWAIQQAT
jgi:delta 1-pyrroline-5-carboxylate dehydrogenase